MFELNVVPLLTAVIGFYAVLFVAIAGILTRLAYVPSRKEFRELQYNLRQEMAANHTDLSDDIGELRQDTGAVRIELKQDIGELRQDMGELRTELKQDIGELRQDMGALRTELKQDIGELRTELKQDMGALRTELRQDMGELLRFTELKQDMTDHYAPTPTTDRLFHRPAGAGNDPNQARTPARIPPFLATTSFCWPWPTTATPTTATPQPAMFTVPPELAPAADDAGGSH